MWDGRAALGAAIVAASLVGAPHPGTPDEAGPVPRPAGNEGRQGLGELSIEDLMSASVVAASNTSERLPMAPATVIVITRDDILERGYSELSEILDDLPGMEVIRPYGATYFKNYWRGYRNTIGDPFLIMLDGIVFNHLYFNTADFLVTFPLSNVERVEVVYGPASSVYGPNAFMGVVNVITVKDRPGSGTSQTVRVAAGSSDSRIADVHFFYEKDDLRVSLAGRFDNGELDQGSGETYEYTRREHYADRRLWGGFVDNPKLGGTFSSPHRHRAMDLRAFLRDVELGVQYRVLDSGYGVEYAGDRAQNQAVWARPDFSLFLRARRPLSDAVSSTSLIRYRRSDVSNDSYFTVSTPGSRPDGTPVQLVDLSYWQALNSSWSFFQDFELKASDRLSFTAGAKYEQKDLQKAYDTVYGPSLPADEVDASRYPYPIPPLRAPRGQNRITTEDTGAYVQGKLRLRQRHQINLGVRSDHNSQYGTATTLRAGYVGDYGRWGAKALYGEAFQEPSPRLLYGGWTGSGSDPNLDPETSRTLEVSGIYKSHRLGGLLSFYLIRNEGTIVNTPSGAQNLGDRTVAGLDGHIQALVPVRGLRGPLRLWAYYSRILKADEKQVGQSGAALPPGRIGDLAFDKVHLGATGAAGDHLTATLRARYVGQRRAVETNPVGRVPGFLTVDGTLVGRDLFVKGLAVSLKVTNLLGEEYFHPGVRDASAGMEPGRFDGAGQWVGSGGFFNSLLPQPGRAALLSLSLDL